MKSKFIAAAVVAVGAMTCMAASADTFNSYLFDQMKAPVTKTRAEVRAEVLQAQPGVTSGSAYNGAVAQQKLVTPNAEKAGTAPVAGVGFAKPRQQ
ncbi:MAG: DUF4148 domain-containing protein [Polaromonas sp.]|uniref:DUF4148 domain-containing protein n=1 Tax=Polaromonas sp. TaxID=1869339 RepID=UPI0017FD9C42|nr:DUF4148 domain-containing protein [Polaromonas sp.]NMM11405.1 DUF4148 domain-containing protein [Polaromonas sp.]